VFINVAIKTCYIHQRSDAKDNSYLRMWLPFDSALLSQRPSTPEHVCSKF